jgi:hypothetical protein
VEREKTLITNNPKEYNIVTGVFYADNEARVRREEQSDKERAARTYWATHDYDAVMGHFYDAEKERQFQEQRRAREQLHGSDFARRLPPSYRP